MHGILNENGKYFWLPIDAKIVDSEKWIFVRDFLDKLESIDCKHILLIIDSCYGGNIYSIIHDKSGGSIEDAVITKETIDTYLSTRSALAITSGTKLKTVPDKSHFFRALNYVLTENEYEYLPTHRLFEKLKTEVYREQNKPGFGGKKIEPQFSKIPYLNDEGGQFVFHKKGGLPPSNDTTLPSIVPSDSRKFKIEKTIYRETIDVKPGDRLEIIASGTITVGQFLGNVTPRGREKGLLGLPIDEYDIAPQYPHGALMYRVAPSQSWVLCGDGCEIKATKAGNMTIEFIINDNNTGDNSGNFDVTLKKL